MMKPHFMRWGLPLFMAGISAFLLANINEVRQIFPFHSYASFVLLLAAGGLTGICCWIALDERRYKRLTSRLLQLATLNVVIIILGLLALGDLFVDLTTLVVWLPLLAGPIMLWMAQERPWGFKLQQPYILELVNNVALAVGAVLFSLILSAVVFRYVLLENHAPVTDDEFEQFITSTKPRPIPRQLDPDKFRILGLSDSFGEAGGRKNYLYVLKTLFADAGVTVEVLNFSRGGYEPFDQLALFKRFAARYQPDLILHGFYVGNDFGAPQSPLLAYRRILLRPETGLAALRPRNFLLRKWLINYMTILRDQSQKASETTPTPPAASIDQPIVVRDKRPKGGASASPAALTEQPMKAKAQVTTKIKTQQSGGTFSQTEFLRIARSHLNIFRTHLSPPIRWQQTAALIDEIRAEAELIGSDYIMVIHPDELQVDHELVLALDEHYDLDLSLYDLALPQRFLLDQCIQDNVTCLDLLPPFKEDPGPLYLPRDTHYNDSGNRVAAEAIFELLRDQGLVSKSETGISSSE